MSRRGFFSGFVWENKFFPFLGAALGCSLFYFGGRVLLCPRRQSNQNAAGGRLRRDTSPAAVSPVAFPPDPHFTGAPPVSWAGIFRRAKCSSVFPLAPGHWALGVQNLVDECVGRTPPAWAEPGEVGGCPGRRDAVPTHRTKSVFVEKRGSDETRHSHQKSPLRAQKGSKASHKVLLPTFLSRKVGQESGETVAPV